MSKKILYFATSNEGKLKEAREILVDFEVRGVEAQINEIQSLNEVEVAKQKAAEYFFTFGKPIFVEDLSLSFNYLRGLPGTYINDFLKVLGNEGLTRLIPKGQDRGAKATTAVVFCWSKDKYRVFKGVVKGNIAEFPRGRGGFGWDSIFIPEGEVKTFAEMNLVQKNRYSMRAIALKKFASWLRNNQKC